MSKQLTTSEFVKKAIEKHGTKFNYDKVEYVNSKSKVIITCKIHGDFLQEAYGHLRGYGCLKCSGCERLTTSIFVEKAKNIHNNKFDYSECRYINGTTKVKIICPVHGPFMQNPGGHLKGYDCFQCKQSKNLTTKKFIEKSISVHGEKYNYDNLVFLGLREKVKIGCNLHGDFLQIASDHLSGCGCPKCGGTKKLTTEQFIEKAKEVHGEKFIYDKTIYKNALTKLEIECKIHGCFKQKPSVHLMGCGCPKCGGTKKLTTEEFINKSILVHKETYDYSNVKYVSSKKKVEIICSKHGSFFQKPNQHLSGRGCQICTSSKGELKIKEILDNKNIEYTPQKRFDNCRNKQPLPFDFYLPKYNLCIEYDGIQHFEPKEYFGGKNEFLTTKKRDEIKNNYCRDNNIKLLRIRYDQDIIEILDKELNG